MKKCAACGKFTSPTDGVKCSDCSSFYDKVCVKLPKTTRCSPNWLCPACVNKAPRRDNTETPVKGCPPSPMDYNMNLDILEELKKFRSEMGQEMEEVKAGISNLSARMNKLFETVDSLSLRLDTLEEKVSKLEEQRSAYCTSEGTDLSETVELLKTQLNDRDQELLMTDIEISGLPECENENLTHVFTLIGTKLGVAVSENDVVNIHRVGPPRSQSPGGPGPSSRVVSVRLTRRSIRDQLLKSARVRRGLDTTNLMIGGPVRRLYLNERLTRTNRQIFRKAREEGDRLRWRYVWTRDGRIYARKQSGTTAIRIRSEADLAKVFGGL
ncbi:unnamed protein product [Colias eurytheme]|nr:unnamed protein product [Colias eurytheme]